MTEARTHRPGPKAILLLVILAILFVLVPFLFWRQTWFGRPLTDRELTQYLEDSSQSRRTQHALVQLSERMVARDASARGWYPGLIRAASSPDPAIRNLAAWTMGQDPSSSLLHDRLRTLLSDPDVQVRRNAALSLVRFGDAAGRAELAAVLRPFEIRQLKEGIVRLLVRPGQTVGAGTPVATIKADGAAEQQQTAPLHGKVAAVFAPDGARLQPGARLITLEPREEDVWEALRALYFVADADDLPDIERYSRGVPDMPERIARQARLTAAAIRMRLAPNSNR